MRILEQSFRRVDAAAVPETDRATMKGWFASVLKRLADGALRANTMPGLCFRVRIWLGRNTYAFWTVNRGQTGGTEGKALHQICVRANIQRKSGIQFWELESCPFHKGRASDAPPAPQPK
jgi:hypothetical protein